MRYRARTDLCGGCPVTGIPTTTGFSVRGKEAVSGEFSLVCTAHNLKKIVKAAMTGWVRPESAEWALIGA